MLDRNSRRRGSALILVMGVLVLLSIVGTAFVLLMRIEAHAARNFVEDAEVQFLARGALSYAIEHPAWDPPTTTVEADGTDWDGLTQTYAAWFQTPLSEVPSDYRAYFAIRKTVFGDRLNVNWNGFYKANADNSNGIQTLNEGYSPTEVSLERAISAYLIHLIQLGYFPGDTVPNEVARAPRIAHEIAGRICNYRYGQDMGTPPTPPYAYFHGDPPAAFSEGPGVLHFPGEDNIDDTQFVDDANLAFEAEPPVPPLVPPQQREYSDIWTTANRENTWIGANLLPLPASVSINWRSDPQRNWVDDDGDGLFDETAAIDNDPLYAREEFKDEPQEFLQGSRLWNGANPLLAPWPNNQDDMPFGSDDMAAIISNPLAVTPLTEIVNDVFKVWAPAQTNPTAFPEYPAGSPTNYFDLLRPIFTTSSGDDVGTLLPLDHQNLLYRPYPQVMTPDEKAAVDAERNKFINAMRSVLTDGGMADSTPDNAATNTAWQIMANLIDYLDDDADSAGTRYWDPGPNTAPRDIITALPKDEGWKANDPAFDNNPANGRRDLGEPGLRWFHGTERQPYLNELWKYNRSSDRFDNDGVADVPPGSDSSEAGKDAYFIEFTNPYATPITLYNNPGAGNETIDWYLRVLDAGGIKIYGIKASQLKHWDGAAWQPCAGAQRVEVPAGGYLVIESQDYQGDNPQLVGRGQQVLDPDALPAKTALLNIMTDAVIFSPGDTVELVYSYSYTYDPGGGLPLVTVTDEVVIDKQTLPPTMGGTAAAPPTYDFKPSYERQDPRLARCVRAAGMPKPLLMETAYAQGGSLLNNDYVRNTLGMVNDNGDGDTGADGNVFDGNYDLGKDPNTRYDDLVDIPNLPTWKFGNVAALGNLLSVGPMPPTPDLGGAPGLGWTGAEWLCRNSPYTAVSDTAPPPAQPLDAKKINFIDTPSADPDDPLGKTKGIFDKFMVWCPWRNGRDDNGNWTMADDLQLLGGPVPGDAHVDEDMETYVSGLVSVNAVDTPEANAVMSALPFVVLAEDAALGTTTTFDPLGAPVTNFYIPVDPTRAAGIRGALQAGPFTSKANFFERVVLLAITGGSFGKDKRDNEIYENVATGNTIRVDQPVMWGTIQRPPRTLTTLAAGTAPMFKLPGQLNNGGDLLVDEKSEIDYTVGALMNNISLASARTAYRVTVQIRGADNVTVRAEKRLIALVDLTVPANDPKRITFLNWAVQ
jgi:hypothetical protein